MKKARSIELVLNRGGKDELRLKFNGDIKRLAHDFALAVQEKLKLNDSRITI